MLAHPDQRPLDLSDELQEGGHHAEGNAPVPDSFYAPKESRQVAQRKGGTQEKARIGTEPAPTHHLPHEVALQGIEAGSRFSLLLHRLQKEDMLQTFLQETLYFSVGFSYESRQVPHSMGDEFPEQEEQGHDEQDEISQVYVHPEQEEPSGQELEAGREQRGDGMAEGIGYHAHVFFQPIGQVSGMPSAQGEVGKAGEMGEKSSLELGFQSDMGIADELVPEESTA